MRNIFRDESNERQFRKDGYIIVDLLDAETIADLCSFATTTFSRRREVVPYARELPHYISIFDREPAHKRDHQSIQCSPPNRSDRVRGTIQVGAEGARSCGSPLFVRPEDRAGAGV